MNYTDAATIRAAMGGNENALDTLLDNYAGIASRAIDHICAQTDSPDAENYFLQQTIVGEQLTNGLIDRFGHLVCYPHKSNIQSVTSVSWLADPRNDWVTADPSTIIVKKHSVEVWDDLSAIRNMPFLALISYTGGMGTTIAALSQTIVDVTTVMAIRKFKEQRSGMSDVVGVVELGTVQYSRGIPASVEFDLQPFLRIWPWT